MSQYRLHVKRRVNTDGYHILKLGLLVGAIFDDLVDRARLHAMRRGQHQLRRDQGAGTKIAPRADDGDDGAADALGRRRAAADDGVSRHAQQQRRGGNDGGGEFHSAMTRERPDMTNKRTE